MNKLVLEKIAPYLLAISAAMLWWKAGISLPKGEGVLGSSLTIGAILTGFLATSKSIVMGLDSSVMSRIRKTRYWDTLVSYLGQAIWLSLSFSAVSITGYFVPENSIWHQWYGILWVFFAVAMGGAFVRVTNIMLRILEASGTD